MAPIKFEEDLKKKLEQRTITPSANSWEALAKKIDAKEEKKGINKKLWFSIAASFIGGMLMYNMFFMPVNENIVRENVVEVENEVKAIETNLNIEKQNVLQEDSKNEIAEEIIEEKNNKIKKNQNNSSYLVNIEASKDKSEKIKDIESNIIENRSNKNNNNAYYVLNETNNDLEKGIKKPSIVLNENAIAVSKTETIEITDSELDALLKNAESKIAKTNTKNTIPLDYNELLQDVEDDLEESFRDKLLRTVKGGYRSVKTYVAERND